MVLAGGDNEAAWGAGSVDRTWTHEQTRTKSRRSAKAGPYALRGKPDHVMQRGSEGKRGGQDEAVRPGSAATETHVTTA